MILNKILKEKSTIILDFLNYNVNLKNKNYIMKKYYLFLLFQQPLPPHIFLKFQIVYK
jgi:hypothetical protein